MKAEDEEPSTNHDPRDDSLPVTQQENFDIQKTVNNDHFRADHGSSFVPGAGPEHLAPKSLDHFKRGYEERAAQRDKEFYTVGGGAKGANERDQAANNQGTNQQSSQPPQSSRRSYNNSGDRQEYDDDNNDYDMNKKYDGYVRNNNKFGRGGGGDASNFRGGGGGGRGYGGGRDFSSSSNGTGFGGRGGRGGGGNRRYMDDPWGYRDRPTVLQGLDINALMDKLAELSQDNVPEKLFSELDRVRDEYKQIFDTGKAMTALISVAARRKQIGLGHAVWDWMDMAKLHKNTFHYNSMISVAEKAKNYQHALDLLNEMTERNIPKNEVTYVITIYFINSIGNKTFPCTNFFFLLPDFRVLSRLVRNVVNGKLR